MSKEDLRIRLLIVEDEQSIRKLCVTVGEALGYVCLEAESGESALALLEEQPAHMVLSDMVMPEMGGRELALTLRGSFPDIAVLLMSGYANAPMLRTEIEDTGFAFIEKPFTASALLMAVAELLAEPATV